MFGIGTTETIVFAILAVVLIGPGLPSATRSMRESINEFQKGVHDFETAFAEDPWIRWSLLSLTILVWGLLAVFVATK